MANTKITTDALADGAITSAKLGSGAVNTQVASYLSSNSFVDTTALNSAVSTAVSNLVGSAPSTLDTLEELATSIGNSATLSSTLTSSIATKLPLAGGTLTGDLILGDSIKLELGAGTGGDLQLYHDGSHSYVTNTYASGALKLVSDDFRIENASNRNQLKTGVSGAVQLFFDDGTATGLRLGTTASGVDVTGNIVVSGNVSAGAAAQVFTSSDRGYFVAGTSDSSNQHLYLGSYHGSTLKQLTFSGSNNALYPQTTASIDLGLSSHKFKNLHLSGTISTTAYGSVIATTSFIQNAITSTVANSSGALIRMAVSSQGNPTYAFEDDTNTGMFTSGADTLNFTTGGVEKMRIDSSGNVGIGDPSPSVKLDVYQSTVGIGAVDFRHVNGNRILLNPSYNYHDAYNHIFRGLNGTDTHMTIDNSGNVGIGTAPSQIFHVQKAADDKLVYGSNPRLLLDTPTGINGLRVLGDTTPFEFKIDSGTYNGSAFQMGGTGDLSFVGTTTTASDTFNDSPTFFFNSQRWNGSANSTHFQGAIKGHTRSAANGDGYLGIGANASANHLNIDASTGNVGIGLTSPIDTKLVIKEVPATIVGGNAVHGSTMKGIKLQTTLNGVESVGLWFGTNSGTHWSGISGQRTTNSAGTGVDGWATDLRFYTHEYASANLTYARERMRIDGEGRLGLGVTPEAWHSVFKVLRVGTGSSISGESGGTSTWFNTNAYYDGAWKRINQNTSAQIAHTSDGKQEFKVSASGSANSAISWTTAMTVDNSGNVLIGQTASSSPGSGNTTQGVAIRGAGDQRSFFSVSNEYVAAFNRSGTNGGIVEFNKAGGHIGTIGVEGNDALYIESGTTSGSGLHFHPTAGVVRPARNGSTIDNAIDLGTANRRFVDLHLSGGIQSAGGSTFTDATPLSFNKAGTDVYTKTVLYDSQNDIANGVFSGLTLEMGRLTNSSSATPRTFTISDRGATNRWCFSQYGLSFNPTSSVATAAESLNDYEEGTWTPDLRDGTTSLSTQTWQYGPTATFTKIGDLVYIHLAGKLSSVAGTGTGELRIYGLPFTPQSTGGYQEYRINFILGNSVHASDSGDAFAFVRNGGLDLGTRVLNGGDTIFTSNRLDSDTFFSCYGCYKT
jgi:hypothetical protein